LTQRGRPQSNGEGHEKKQLRILRAGHASHDEGNYFGGQKRKGSKDQKRFAQCLADQKNAARL